MSVAGAAILSEMESALRRFIPDEAAVTTELLLRLRDALEPGDEQWFDQFDSHVMTLDGASTYQPPGNTERLAFDHALQAALLALHELVRRRREGEVTKPPSNTDEGNCTDVAGRGPSERDRLLYAVQDTLFILTQTARAPARLLNDVEDRSDWKDLVLWFVEALIGEGLATIEGGDRTSTSHLKHLRDHPYDRGGDDQAWETLLVSLTGLGVLFTAEMRIVTLGQPLSTSFTAKAEGWGIGASTAPAHHVDAAPSHGTSSDVAAAIADGRWTINIRVLLDDGGQLVVFLSDNANDPTVSAIVGREVFRCDVRGAPMWQIAAEAGTTDSRTHPFDHATVTSEPFVSVFEADGNYYASRWNGDTFVIDMSSGKASYSGWART